MKALLKILALMVFTFFVAITTFAQSENKGSSCDGTQVPDQTKTHLRIHDKTGTGERSGLNENGYEFRNAFKASLTEDQLAIIENMEMTREQKREALQETFSEAQREMFRYHFAEVAKIQSQQRSKAISQDQAMKAVQKQMRNGQK